MAITNIVKVKIRRGTELQRRTVIFDQGELGYVTDGDSRRVFVGDGITYGGVPVSMKFYSGNIQTTPNTFARAQVGDLIYDTGRRGLFVLSGVDSSGFANYASIGAYQNINPKVDNITICYDGSYQLSVINESISARHISSEAFDLNSGFLREVPNGALKINIDNTSIQFNGLRKLYVEPTQIDWTKLPTSDPGAGTKKMWIDTVNGNIVKVAL